MTTDWVEDPDHVTGCYIGGKTAAEVFTAAAAWARSKPASLEIQALAMNYRRPASETDHHAVELLIYFE